MSDGATPESVGEDAGQDRADHRAGEEQGVKEVHGRLVEAERTGEVEHHERRHDVEPSAAGSNERCGEDEAQVAATEHHPHLPPHRSRLASTLPVGRVLSDEEEDERRP